MPAVADTVSPETRSRMMSRVRSKDTGPELAVRRTLWRAGLRYRVHDRTLPGTPDISNKSKRLAVFVDGCFWHGCPECYAEPKSNVDFWRSKIIRNRRRREEVREELERMGFRVVEIWEHEVAGDPDAAVRRLCATLGGRVSTDATNAGPTAP